MRYFVVPDFVVVVVVDEPGVELGDDDGLPVVPVSPVLEVPAVVAPGEVEAVPAPVLLPGMVEAVLLGGVVSVDDDPDGVDGVVVLAELGGVVVVVVVLVDACFSQPVTAAPAKARTATTGMSFFMTSPMTIERSKTPGAGDQDRACTTHATAFALCDRRYPREFRANEPASPEARSAQTRGQ